MVKRCAWGTCNSDERYPERLGNTKFIPFPKPKTQFNTCLRWIRACGRPQEQLNVHNINKHKYVCSKHFKDNRPTEQHPDPYYADGSQHAYRPPPKKRCFECRYPENLMNKADVNNNSEVKTDVNNNTEVNADVNNITEVKDHCEASTQTETGWISPMDLLSVTSTIHELNKDIKDLKLNLQKAKWEVTEKDKEIKYLKEQLRGTQKFGIDSVLEKSNKLKNIFQYYTGVTYVRFLALLSFLVPEGGVTYETGRRDILTLPTADCLFLTMCRLRHNFGLKDVAMRFCLSLQSSGVIFNTWISLMYFKLGQLSIWPHRDIIIGNMPKEFHKEFPTTFVILDGTEIRTEKPCAVGLQSQLYSDYKSSTTLKCLVGCDPNGSLIFVSELFTGSISDKAITEESGFYDLVKDLIAEGYIRIGDSVMADKGFTIEPELKTLGLHLNIPPFVSSETQMTASETQLSEKIAKHRIHVERLIGKIKKFKIVSGRIPTSLFKNINQIWTVCSFLTLFQDVLVRDKV